MLKEYEWNGGTWQFDEKDAPSGAVEVKRGNVEQPAEGKAEQPAEKAKAPANKGRTANTKAE